jgi:hypothetical protein
MIYQNKITGEIVEAMQFKGDNAIECKDFFGENASTYSFGLHDGFERNLVIGTILVPRNSYIIKGRIEECIWNQTTFEIQFTKYKE